MARLEHNRELSLAVLRPILSNLPSGFDRVPLEMSQEELKEADLPAELWARVSAHMSLRDWVRVSGTCRSTRAVRLKKLTINRKTPAAGVQRASRMLESAEALRLPAHYLQQIEEGVAEGLYSIKQLQQLIIDAPPCTDSMLSCLSWLLTEACKVEVLVTPAGSRPYFPPMAALKHLQLTFFNDPGNFCRAVRNCTALETLHLHTHEGRMGSKVFRLGGLEMDGLPHLRLFVLKAYAQDLIKVPKGCQVHIQVYCGTDMQRSMWRGVLGNIHSIDASILMPDAPILEVFLDKAFTPLQNLRILNLHVYSSSFVFNLAEFARVEKLCISGRNLNIYLPAGVSWDTLELDAKDKLNLKFEDLNGFLLSVPRFAARFRFLRNTQALQLCTAMALNGIKCAFEDPEEEQDKYMFWYPVEQRPFGCCCGACLDCLVASGQAVEHVAEAGLPHHPPPQHDIFEFDYGPGIGGLFSDEEEEIFDEEDEEEGEV
ncbi:hypothetical protein COCOBI_07-1420 [Coccomyxa sp. Obi]|nr:hypothetical protein COCOBI_07-1420 [Coccomyxa sp. Obi]